MRKAIDNREFFEFKKDFLGRYQAGRSQNA
jgi:queuine/archaeosine tRNA-ribosyltransferase